MKISAVICEFSPFHFGHEYLISKIKEQSDAVICVMSGTFTERGELGIMSKYDRAEAAILGGADLVLELPFPFSACGAERFAMGGVDVINALGCVDELAFGSERGDAAAIMTAARRVLSPEFSSALEAKMGQSRGTSFGDVYFGTYRSLYGDDGLFLGSNDILAVAYARRLIELGADIDMRAIVRRGQKFDGSGDGFLSASEIRRRQLSGGDTSGDLPKYSYDILKREADRGAIFSTELLFAPLAAIYRTGGGHAAAYEMNDEIYNRITSAFACATSLFGAVELAATKQFSPSKIRRAMMFGALGVMEDDVKRVEYTTLLAANSRGRDILSSIRKSAKIDIVTKPASYGGHAYNISCRADALAMLAAERALPSGENMKRSPIII